MSKYKDQINPLTGLPKLPEGYFFRVGMFSFTVWGTDYPVFGVGIMHTVPAGWRGKKTEDVLWRKRETPAIDEDVFNAALNMAEELYKDIKARRIQARLTGDYPPKHFLTE